MTPSPNFINARRRVLAAAVVASMSAPLSVSAAMAAQEEQVAIGGTEVQSTKQTDRQVSTVAPAPAQQEDVLELQSEPSSIAETNDQIESQDSGDNSSELPRPDEYSTANDQAAITSDGVIAVQEDDPETGASFVQQSVSEQQQNAHSPSDPTEPAAQGKEDQTTVAAVSERSLLSAEQHENSEQLDAKNRAPDAPASEALNQDESQADDNSPGEDLGSETENEDNLSSAADDEEQPIPTEGDDQEDKGKEDEEQEGESDKEEPTDSPIFSPNGPSIDFSDAPPETEYIIRVGESERTYTTDQHGSAAINVLEDFELPPGKHQVAIVNPDGQTQDVTFYATAMQAQETQVNILGLNPAVTYQLSLDGQIAHVGNLDFTPQPDGTFTADILQQFPNAWPGRHAVTLTGGGYTQKVYIQIPVLPPNPDPEPVPNPDPEPVPNPDPEPNPAPEPDSGESLFPLPEPSFDETKADNSSSTKEKEDTPPPAIDILDAFQAAEAVEPNRPPSHESAELPMASGDQTRQAAPETPDGAAQHEQRLEAAPMPHSPVPLDQAQDKETPVLRNAPLNPESHPPNRDEQETAAQGADNLKTERASMSPWGRMALLAAAVVILPMLAVLVFGRKKKHE